MYDKVLCDVPCSGDGAIRKIPNKWRFWSYKDGCGLHGLQVFITFFIIYTNYGFISIEQLVLYIYYKIFYIRFYLSFDSLYKIYIYIKHLAT